MTPGPEPARGHRVKPAGDRRGILGGMAILVLVLGGLATLASATWVGGDPERFLAVGVVSAVCGLASLGGWAVARLGAGDPALAVSRSLGGTVFRLLPPLALLGWLADSPWAPPLAHRLREAGTGGLLVAFYLAMLATDILLHIMWGPQGRGDGPHAAGAPASARPAPPSTPVDSDGHEPA